MTELSNEEYNRYSRHLLLSEMGVEGQLKLKSGSVLVVGAGGLGCPAIQYLAAAGVGTIGIVDYDKIEASNLQRQILFITDDIGKQKAEVAAARVSALNPNVRANAHSVRLAQENAIEIATEYDVIIDGTDNFATRYLLNDLCILTNKPLVYGSVLRFEGHLAVFNVLDPQGIRSCNYRDLYPSPPAPETVPDCAQAGVIGVLPGIVGTMQALEAIKLLSGFGKPLCNQLLIVEGETLSFTTFVIRDRGTRHSISKLIDYDFFCKSDPKYHTLADDNNSKAMKEITVQQLKKLMDDNEDFQLIDVREPHEYDICNLQGELIPLSQIPHNVDKIDRERMVVMHCRSGKRSGDTILWLEQNHEFSNLYNLKGGILAWARDIDSDMPTY